MYGDIYCTVDIVSTLLGLLEVLGVLESLESLEVLGLLDLLELLEALGLLVIGGLGLVLCYQMLSELYDGVP